jgi:hypothetical protein
MKKYFLHNGTTHEGPFDIEELKVKGITNDTSIWFDGLDDWTTVDKVEELKGLVKSKPQMKKPAISKALIIVAVLIMAVAAIIIISRPKPEPVVKATTPKPIVVIQSADFSKTGVLKLKSTIYTTILNQGADGNILVTFHVQQKGHDYSKTKSIFLKANESQQLEMVFDEMKILEGDVSYSVGCRAEK